MTPAELAILRDKVARARLDRVEIGVLPRPRKGWTEERNAAGDQALRALRAATGKQAFKEAVAPRQPRGSYKRRQRRCVYCGLPTNRWTRTFPPTCHGHDDLPVHDPAYQAEILLREGR